MPASKNLTPEQTLDMVHYLLSLSTEEQRKSVILRREHLEVAQVNQLPTDDSDQAWSASKAVELQTFPLWWRDGAEPRLRVQALRNADTLAIRLQWRDASHDVELGQVDQFQDLVAVEWYQGETEPFLGMGSASTRVDLWQWRAGDPRSADRDSILDEYPFETSVYEKLARGQPLPDFRTARVSGNPLAVGTPSAGSLVAGGPSSTTFRPRASQVVEGRGSWRNGTWTVVLRRRLQVPEDAGLTVTQGSRYSVAFALWDGAARDRGPQKQVSVWHDLQVR